MSQTTQRSISPSTIILLLLIVVATILLAASPTLLIPLAPQLVADPRLQTKLAHQLLTLPIAFTIILAVRILAPHGIRFLRIGQLNAPFQPAPAVRIVPAPHENWLHIGRNFALILTTITAIVVGLQVSATAKLDFTRTLHLATWILLLSASNAFVEEIITRFAVLAALYDRIGPQASYIASGVLFGTAHYFGVPGGIIGAIVSGFLGWLLAKSIGETKGIAWAWFLHFLQDVVIFSFIFAAA